MEVDPRFKAARIEAVRRQRRGWLLPLILWSVGGLFFLGVPAGLYFAGILTVGNHTPTEEAAEETVTVAPVYASLFIDVAGDPMLLRFDQSAKNEHSRTILRPPDVSTTRAGNDLVLLQDDMITRQDRLITTLPSSREDFAFFQAQRQATGTQAPVSQPVTQTGTSDSLQMNIADDETSWGESIGGDSATGSDTFTRTVIENTTSLSYIRQDDLRTKPHDDIILQLRDTQDLLDIMTQNDLEAKASQRFAEAAIALLPDLGHLSGGHILAIRGADIGGALPVPVQLSAYTNDLYIGSVALNDLGEVVTGADPWVAEDLFTFADTSLTPQADTSRKYRLLDAFYSAAMRNGVPSAIVGETIVMMSQSFDLESFAGAEDTMTLLYARAPGSEGPGPGQILYASITGPNRDLKCYVYHPQGKTDYTCFGTTGQSGGVRLREGMVTPVQGVLTSGYGPRMHPILKTAKLHRGVDWAAPTGTPVTAAFDGKIIAAGDGKGYGNLVRISHPDGTETRYAHLNQFSDLAKSGQQVRAGDVIGYVGTTGLSTGPHLHFELHEKGKPVDPFASAGSITASSAVEQLTDRIIRVESGGKADAKNPLSSATGLGQFIESTWVRMMRTYRPDLSSTMSRADLLSLRFDPTISREMVQNLAREGESYLKSRGHQITAGRLYLAHFLGAQGAHTVLSSDDSALILDVMGAGVVNANPFLTGRDVAYVKNWAERKMRGKGGPPPPPPLPPEVRTYQKIIARVLKGA